MGRSKELGMVLMAVAAFQMLVTTIGMMRRSYMIIALPVVTAVAVVSALTFWVGWTMMNTDADLAELEETDGVPAMV